MKKVYAIQWMEGEERGFYNGRGFYTYSNGLDLSKKTTIYDTEEDAMPDLTRLLDVYTGWPLSLTPLYISTKN